MINPSEFMEVLKVIHCMSYGEVRKCLNVDSWPCKDEFDDLFNAMRKDLFHGLCNMDTINQELLVTYSMNKMHQTRGRINRMRLDDRIDGEAQASNIDL